MEKVYLGFANESGLKYLVSESESNSDQVMRRSASFADCIAFWSVLDLEAISKVRKLFATDRSAAWNCLKTHATRFGRLA